MHTQTIGQLGENLAVSFLEAKGFFILDRNYRTPYGEIDIVAMDGDDILFYEVKYRTNGKFGTPDEALSPSKLQKIRKSIEVWISQRGREVFFDNIYLNAILVNPDKSVEEYELE